MQDLPASQRFYQGALKVLGITVGDKGDGFFRADELCVFDRDTAAQSELTGRHT
ncbi:lactoylglutathione lyase [Xanthomonas fragariae LMG 25863]|nr:lactoylglutathione lyase [Xanthomonas fragariae LMG 25863]